VLGHGWLSRPQGPRRSSRPHTLHRTEPLIALGFKKTLGDVEHELKIVPAAALLGGTAVYLVAHVAFRWRNVHRFSAQRAVAAVACLALIPAAVSLPAIVTLSLLAGLLCVLVAYERVRFAELRDRLRHQVAAG
jgi:hypothetical protein